MPFPIQMPEPKFINRLDLVASIISVGAMQAVNETAAAIAETGAANSPRDKGVLAVSHYALLEGEDHDAAFTAVVASAAALNPKVEMVQDFGIEDLSGEGIHQAGVEVAAPYAEAVHNGYGSVAGRPWLEEAANSEESAFKDRIGRIAERLK